MLKVDLLINRKLIGVVTIVNIGPGKMRGFDEYQWTVIIDETVKAASETHGRVQHRRVDGAFELTAKVFQALTKPKPVMR